MLKRVRWMGMGAVAGVGASAWVQRRLRQTLQQHPSIQVGADVAAAARRVGREVKGAVADGRQVMAEREAFLRAELGVPRIPGSVPPPADLGRPRLRVVDAPSSPLRRVLPASREAPPAIDVPAEGRAQRPMKPATPPREVFGLPGAPRRPPRRRPRS